MKATTLGTLKSAVHDLRWASSLIQEDTNAVLVGGNHVELIKHFNDLRLANEDIKQARKALDILEDRLSRSEIPDAFRALKERTGEKPPFLIEDIGRVSVGHRWACSIIENKKVDAFSYVRGRGDGGIITETINSSTLAAYAKSLVDTKGLELPQDIFKTSINAYTSITKV